MSGRIAASSPEAGNRSKVMTKPPPFFKETGRGCGCCVQPVIAMASSGLWRRLVERQVVRPKYKRPHSSIHLNRAFDIRRSSSGYGDTGKRVIDIFLRFSIDASYCQLKCACIRDKKSLFPNWKPVVSRRGSEWKPFFFRERLVNKKS